MVVWTKGVLWADDASVGADLIVYCAHLSQYSELGSTTLY